MPVAVSTRFYSGFHYRSINVIYQTFCANTQICLVREKACNIRLEALQCKSVRRGSPLHGLHSSVVIDAASVYKFTTYTASTALYNVHPRQPRNLLLKMITFIDGVLKLSHLFSASAPQRKGRESLLQTFGERHFA